MVTFHNEEAWLVQRLDLFLVTVIQPGCWSALQVAQACLEHLLREGKFQEAASQCPRLLKVIALFLLTKKICSFLYHRQNLEKWGCRAWFHKLSTVAEGLHWGYRGFINDVSKAILVPHKSLTSFLQRRRWLVACLSEVAGHSHYVWVEYKHLAVNLNSEKTLVKFLSFFLSYM